MMSFRITKDTGSNDITPMIFTTILQGNKMLSRTLKSCGLSNSNPMLISKCFWLC